MDRGWCDLNGSGTNQDAYRGINDRLSVDDFGGRDLAEYSGEVDDGNLGDIERF
ncbi:hypothetical protein ISN45_At03g035550, partial [Arabidopsis thaliana x Arabidopsis arenosa]